MKFVIVDIDGTLSRPGDRLKYIQGEKKDWDSFYDGCHEDEPIQEVIDLVNNLRGRYRIAFCTGRRDSTWAKTSNWLFKHVGHWVYGCHLLMRKGGDCRHDTEVKPELLNESGIKDSDVAFVLENRNSMVKKWRELGFTCLQVAEGNF